METIINFLKNPQIQGLHVHQYKIELSKIAEFIDHVTENYKIQGIPPIPDGSPLIERFVEREKRMPKIRDRRLANRLNEALTLIILKEDKPEIFDYFKISLEELEKQRKAEGPQAFWRTQRLLSPTENSPRSGFFDSMIFPEHHDVLHMNYRMSKDEENMLIEFVSLNEKGFKMFNDLILCLPILSESFDKISQRKSSCEKYIFKIYDLVVQLWIPSEDKFVFNDNIENFLEAAITYYTKKEWITSIILSSIAVESILAELYEEEHKKKAPDIPLGQLIKEVGKKIKFPSDLEKKLQALNTARIASVHRSENPVSDKDTIISLMGITSLIIWYFENY